LRYEIGYSINGKHEGYIIVPSYDSNGELNYYYTRKYQENRGYKTINPPFSKNDIIFFESLINFEEEITLVESVFDAISIRRNAVPLMGKKLSEVLLMKLVENKPPRINIMLDGDAKSDAIKIAKTLMENGLDVYLIFLNEKDDPNDLGFDQCWDYIKNITTQVTNLDLIQYKTRLR